MPFQTLRRAFVAVFFVVIGLGLTAQSAFADPTTPVVDCNQQVLDLTAEQVLKGDTTIDPVVKELDSQGVDVRVRMFDDPPGGSLDAYEATQIKTCPSWGVDGHIKPNLVVVLVTLEHHDAIFYGKNFASTMESEVDSIRGSMRDPYQKGHYAEAIVTGLHNSSEVIKGNQNPATKSESVPAWVWSLVIIVAIVAVILVAAAFSGGGGRRGRGRGRGGYGGRSSSSSGSFMFFSSSGGDSSGGGSGGGDGGSSGSC